MDKLPSPLPLLTLTLGLLALSACAATEPASPQPDTRQTVRYLALGDSYTIGESVEESQRWPIQLAQQLQQRGVRVETSIIARTGWTTAELWEGIQQNGVNPPYDLVSLLIGVNNQYRGYSSEEYRTQFRFLLEKAVEYAGGDAKKVFVVSIPDWGVTRFALGRDSTQIAAEIDAFNAINRAEAEAAGVAYIDITPYSRTASVDSDLIAPDGLHPSGQMYAGWVERILPVALDALNLEP